MIKLRVKLDIDNIELESQSIGKHGSIELKVKAQKKKRGVKTVVKKQR